VRLLRAHLLQSSFDCLEVRAGHVVAWVERKRLSKIGHSSPDIVAQDSNITAIGIGGGERGIDFYRLRVVPMRVVEPPEDFESEATVEIHPCCGRFFQPELRSA